MGLLGRTSLGWGAGENQTGSKAGKSVLLGAREGTGSWDRARG